MLLGGGRCSHVDLGGLQTAVWASRPKAPVSAPSLEGASDEARALAGDRAAWDALIVRHERRVVVSLLGCGLPIDRAKELAHEAWVLLVERQRRGELTELRLPGLAIAQAGFLARDERRRQLRVDRRAGRPEAASAVLDRRPGAEERLLYREQLARAVQRLETLRPAARQTFLMLYEEAELTHREAAARLGLSEQRVRQIVCEVRRSLREALEEPDA
jgi:RNA polymerase sigma-70 factor (ECF subfamily)